MFEQQIRFKSDGGIRDGNGATFLHLSSTSGATTMFQMYPYSSFLMPTMWNFSW